MVDHNVSPNEHTRLRDRVVKTPQEEEKVRRSYFDLDEADSMVDQK
jgi:hypothetical protein